MSFFHHSARPILTRSDYTVFLDAELDSEHPTRIGRMLFTGHDGSNGVVRAWKAGEVLWDAKFVSEHDVTEGLLVFTEGLVISHDRSGKALVARDQWSGHERWRTPLGKLVDRLGIDRSAQEIVAITFDHAVHGIAIATGADRIRGSVATDEERDTLIRSTPFPCPHGWNAGSSLSRAPTGWSDGYAPHPQLQVLKRNWAGTHSWGLASADGKSVRELGRGTYEGAQRAGPLTILSFELSGRLESEDDGEGELRRHFYLLGEGPGVLGIVREGGKSELFDQGQSCWSGAV